MQHGKFEMNGLRGLRRESQGEKESVSLTKSILLYLHDLVYLLGFILLVLLLFLRVVIVSGSSMNPTLIGGDYLLLLSSPLYHSPEYGDIIVASKDSFEDGEPIIKRVIAVAGQTVDIDFSTGTVYVDGSALEEDYISSATTIDEGMQFPLVVDDGCVFVLGDNRIRSQDSRSPAIGLIDNREILGRAVFLFLPGIDENTKARDFSRIGGVS